MIPFFKIQKRVITLQVPTNVVIWKVVKTVKGKKALGS